MKKKLRALGDITGDMEPFLFEMVADHDMQKHEVLAIISGWIDVHYPQANEEYIEGGRPILRGTYYGFDKKGKKS